jgi:prepilin-type N-terminal cleavage/methylation domain-containing protein
MSARRSGFTLVELLVVIAIIGILVALLLPAVQAAREAGRRSQCSNNLKQLALSMHNFHDTLKNRLPPGAGNDVTPFGTGGAGWGSSWMVYILPFMEQTAIHEQWQFHSSSGYTNSNNMNLVGNATIPAFRCPSSPVPDRMVGRGGVNVRLMNVSYTGIAGSVMPGIATATPVYNVGCCNGSGPLATDNGVLFAGSRIGLGGITDGTSNTWMIGEQSDHLRDANRQPVIAGYTAGYGNSGGLYGWTMGANHPTGGGQAGWGDGRHFNCTSVRYRINQTGFTNAAASGTNNDVGTNFPIMSAHPGGVINALADGSNRFFSSQMDPVIINAFCTRAGGEPLTDN